MILGILSDTHGDHRRAAQALSVLERAGAAAFVHCGDYGSLAVLDQLAGRTCWVVNGNTDSPDAATRDYAANLGFDINSPPPRRFTLAGRRVAVFHGHEPSFTRLINATLATGLLPEDFAPCDYLLYGHTHVACDSVVGPLRVINPGALYRAVTYTVATLDVARDQLRYWVVPDDDASSTPVAYDPRRDCFRAPRSTY